MAVSVRKPVLYAFGVVLCAGIIGGIAGIGADGNAITPYVNYLDSRTADDVEALKAQKLAIWGKERAMPNRTSCSRPCSLAGS